MIEPLDVMEAGPPLREKRKKIKKDEFGKVQATKDDAGRKDKAKAKDKKKRKAGKMMPFSAVGVVDHAAFNGPLQTLREGLLAADTVEGLAKDVWKRKCKAQGHKESSVLKPKDVEKIVEAERVERVIKAIKQDIINKVGSKRSNRTSFSQSLSMYGHGPQGMLLRDWSCLLGRRLTGSTS